MKTISRLKKEDFIVEKYSVKKSPWREDALTYTITYNVGGASLIQKLNINGTRRPKKYLLEHALDLIKTSLDQKKLRYQIKRFDFIRLKENGCLKPMSETEFELCYWSDFKTPTAAYNYELKRLVRDKKRAIAKLREEIADTERAIADYKKNIKWDTQELNESKKQLTLLQRSEKRNKKTHTKKRKET